MDIAEVTNLSNLPASTLRYYEKKELIKSVGKRGVKRVFSENVIEKLAFITQGRASGLSLDEIKRCFYQME